MSKQKPIKIDITHRTIIFTVLFILGLMAFKATWGILVAIFISLLIATAVYPLIERLEKLKIPKGVSAFIILLLIFVGLIASFASIIPPMIDQTSSFIRQLPALMEQIPGWELDPTIFTSQINSLPGNILKVAVDTFSFFIFSTTIFVVSFYIMMERANIDKRLKLFFGENSQKAKKIYIAIEKKLGHWVRSMIFLMLIIGVQTYIGLTLMGIKYALPLAIIAGLLEIVTSVGPTISAIPAAIVGFATSPLHGFMVIGLYLVVQLLENNIIVPAVMKQTVGLHPLVTIISLLIGFELGGVLLAVLSLPLVLTGQIVLEHLYPQADI